MSTQFVKRSDYGAKSTASASKPAASAVKPAASKQVERSEEESKTTHYAYTLVRNEDGSLAKDENGKAIKNFVNDVVIYANETQYGTTLKVKILGSLPVGSDMFIQKKRVK